MESSKDITLPLDVTLEDLYTGSTRHVKINKDHLKLEGHSITQDSFQVQVEQGAADGHKVVFKAAANAGAGDVSFVLQERRHQCWRRTGLDLYMDHKITLREALIGYRIVIRHLDGRKLVVKSRPGEIVRPQNLMPDAEAEWERHDNTDSFAGLDAGAMKTDDIESCKEYCRQKGYSGFTYWEDTAYFRYQSRAQLLAGRKQSKGSTLFICPDPQKSASLRMQRAVRGAGMPCFGKPALRGNLFLLLRVQMPEYVDKDAADVLRAVFPPVLEPPLAAPEGEHKDIEELELCDIDPVESQRRQRLAKNGSRPGCYDEQDEAPPPGSPGPPPCQQM